MYLGVRAIGPFYGEGFTEVYLPESEGPYDASACCQACVEESECAASVAYAGSCELYYTNGTACGNAFELGSQPDGGFGFDIQAGCGEILVDNDE